MREQEHLSQIQEEAAEEEEEEFKQEIKPKSLETYFAE